LRANVAAVIDGVAQDLLDIRLVAASIEAFGGAEGPPFYGNCRKRRSKPRKATLNFSPIC
jgi:hypothetical protein